MENAMASPGSTIGRCVVCLAKKNGSYLRLELCRACAVFFRRAIKSTTGSFICRSATGNCRIERERIYACAKCRFERILNIMMQQEKVTESGPTKVLDWNYGPIPESENFSWYLDEFRPMNVSPSLRRFSRSYNDLCRERLIIDFGSLYDLPFNENGKIEAPATYAACTGPAMIQVREAMRTFLLSASDDYAHLRPEYQNRLLGSFMKQFVPFETFYRFYGTFGRYIDMDNVADFYEDGMADNIFKKEALKILHEGTRKNSDILVPAMEKLALTDEECIGITAMQMWNVECLSDSDELGKLAEAKKRAALHDLYMYYKSVGVTDYASRLGEIFVFLSLHENLANEAAATMQGLKFLGVFKEEPVTVLDNQLISLPD